MSHNGTETAEYQLVLSLASGVSMQDAAERAGVSKRTVYRRLEDPDFRRQVSKARSDLYSQAAGMLAANSVEAVTTLQNLANDATSENVRLSAAKTMLELGSKLREAAELDERLTELESRLDDQTDSQQIGNGGAAAFPFLGRA